MMIPNAPNQDNRACLVFLETFDIYFPARGVEFAWLQVGGVTRPAGGTLPWPWSLSLHHLSRTFVCGHEEHVGAGR